MRKSERRDLIRSIYPAVCRGVDSALATYWTLTHGRQRRAKCIVCGQPIVTKVPGIARCQMHQMKRLAMRGSLRLNPPSWGNVFYWQEFYNRSILELLK